MYKKEFTLTICVLLIMSVCCGVIIASGNSGVKLRVSLEPQPVAVTVSGKVTDKKNGEPIENALVRGHIVIKKYRGPDFFEKCPYLETMTDADGNYQLQFITPLTISGPSIGKDLLCIDVGAAGYETEPKYVRPYVTPDHTDYVDFNFELEEGKLVKGTVVDEDGNPVEDVSVRVQNGYNGDWTFFASLGHTYTRKDGSFEVWIGRADKDYQSKNPWICVFKQGKGTGFIWDILKKEDMGTLVLSSGGEIKGRLIDTDGNGVANCEISVRGWPCNLIGKVLTDDEGYYTLRGIPGDPTVVDFMKKKNSRYVEGWGKVKVYADVNPEISLRDVPQYEIMAQEGKTISGPELVVGTNASVSGKLIASENSHGLGGLMVRLDGSWDNMVEADADGNFNFPFVSAGKHRLTAYLPHNLRYDRGIGQAEIEIQAGKPVKDIQIQLEELVELRVQYLDMDGNPVKGISASATWSESGDGSWTEGTKSDDDGWAVLYLYPNNNQYVRGFDSSRELVAESSQEVNPRAGEAIDHLTITMVPVAGISGRILDQNNQPIAEKVFACKLEFADGVVKNRKIKTDSEGHFEIDYLTPGIVQLSLEIDNVEFNDVLEQQVEIKPGQKRDLMDVILNDGLDKDKIIREKHAGAMEHPEEIVDAAEQFFDKIQNADYEYFLKKGAHWSSFPIVGYYQTHHWFDNLANWICTTFKDNPIVKIELGNVFKNPEVINKKKELPTIPYKLTLKDGTILEGNLPFEYNFDGGKGHWHGIEGIDWHLKD